MNLWGKKIELICNFISFVQWECLIKVQWSCETVAMNGAWHKGRCPNISCSLMERHSKAVLFSITLYGLNCEIMHRHHDWNDEKDEGKKTKTPQQTRSGDSEVKASASVCEFIIHRRCSAGGAACSPASLSPAHQTRLPTQWEPRWSVAGDAT